MKKIVILIMGVIMAVSFVSCASSDSISDVYVQDMQPSVYGSPVGSWELVELSQSGKVIPSEVITLHIEQEGSQFRASGQVDNSYGGDVTFDGVTGSFRFGMMITTSMAGPNMAFESEYLSRIALIDSYHEENGKLSLFSRGELVAVYVATL